ncbi:MAG: M20/M25/M40 family metallo-hydrolase, partial [Clostridiales bacterium]|nr:M20/M25/M40 family metallo-hydrolase [Clostridiales bacterium]
GKRANMVCDYCEAVPRAAVDLAGTELTMQDNKIISLGKSAHGSTPALGKNAILPILELFRENEDVNRVIECLFEDVFGLRHMMDETGSLTLSPDIITFHKGVLAVVCDIRYPATVALSDVLSAVNKFGVKYETLHHQKPLFHDKNSGLITTLLGVYKEFAAPADDVQPIAIGGGTYARALKNGVAFGPEMHGDEAVIHQPNEYITLDRVKLLLNIYKAAIERLTK